MMISDDMDCFIVRLHMCIFLVPTKKKKPLRLGKEGIWNDDFR